LKSPDFKRRACSVSPHQTTSEIFSILIFLGGCTVLIGWIADLPLLKSLHPGMATMKANSAICFLLIGLSLWLLQSKRLNSPAARVVSLLSICAIFLTGSLTVLEYLFSMDLGIDQLFFKELPGAVLTPHLGRMAFNTAIQFTLISISLFLLTFGTGKTCTAAQLTVLPVGVIALLSFAGYLYHAQILYRGPSASTAMAFHTVFLFLAVFIGVLFCRPDRGLMANITSEHAGGRMMRWLLPIAVAIPLILEWLKLYGERLGSLPNEFGVAFVATSNILIVSLYLYFLAARLNKTDARRKLAEDEIAVYETKYRRLFEAAQDGILLLDAETGQIVDVNPYLIKMLGYEREDLLKKKLWEIGMFKDIAASEAAFCTLQNAGYIRYEDLPLKTKDGHVIEVEFVSNRYLVDHKNVMQCNIRNIAERKRLEKLREDIEQTVYHELRNPLSIVHLGLSTVLKGTAGSITSEQKDMLTQIAGMVDRLFLITDELLDVAKLEKSKNKPSREIFDAAGLIKEIAAFFELMMKAKGLELRITLPSKRLEVYADRAKTFQIFSNLLSNAMKFTNTGFVEISAVDMKDRVEFTVADTGRGISEEDLPHVFDEFTQFGTLSVLDKGIGLGLSIVKEIVELHDGTIWIESKLGEGTRVRFTLAKISNITS